MTVIEERDCLILDAAWHPSGRLVATAGSDGLLRVFSPSPPFAPLLEWRRPRAIRRCEWSPSGEFLAAASFDGSATVFRLSGSALERVGELRDGDFGHESEVKSVRWSPRGDMLVTVGRDRTACVWSFPDIRFVSLHNEHRGDVKDCRFAPGDAQLFATVSFDGTAKLWAPGDELGALQTLRSHEGTVWALAFNPANGDLATAGEDGVLVLHRRGDDGEYARAAELRLQERLEPLYALAFADGRWIAAGSERRIFVVAGDLSAVLRVVETGNIGDINCAAPNPVNPKQLLVGSDDGTVTIVEIEEL